jgi:hypothetical protein
MLSTAVSLRKHLVIEVPQKPKQQHSQRGTTARSARSLPHTSDSGVRRPILGREEEERGSVRPTDAAYVGVRRGTNARMYDKKTEYDRTTVDLMRPKYEGSSRCFDFMHATT